MTLIESALRKMKEGAERQNADSDQRRGSSSKAGDRTAETARRAEQEGPAQTYLPATVDPAVMELNCILTQMDDQVARRAYKILRTRLLQRLTTNQWYSLALTGTQAQQGKTTTAINLAIALAQDVHTSVFLVDLDLPRPRVASYLGMKFESGLSEYLTGEVEVDKIIYESGFPRLAIIPNSKPMPHSSELLSSPRMAALLNTLATSTPRRIIIFDMPPLLLADDVLAFAPNIDGVLLVATEGATSRSSLQSAKELLAEMNVVGVILNRSSERSESYDY
jgi:protein-tyrosine kinase